MFKGGLTAGIVLRVREVHHIIDAAVVLDDIATHLNILRIQARPCHALQSRRPIQSPPLLQKDLHILEAEEQLACEDVERGRALPITGGVNRDACCELRMREGQNRLLAGDRLPLVAWQRDLESVWRADEMPADYPANGGAAAHQAAQDHEADGQVQSPGCGALSQIRRAA